MSLLRIRRLRPQPPRGFPFAIVLQMIQELGQRDSMRRVIGAVRLGQLGLIDPTRTERGNDGCALSYARVQGSPRPLIAFAVQRLHGRDCRRGYQRQRFDRGAELLVRWSW